MPTLLGGRYRLDTLIGGGGMGEVWQAHDEVLDRVVAIKIIRPHLADDENVRARLRVEAQLAGRLHHPGIVDVFDYGEDEEDGKPVPFLVMPLIDGAPLSAVLADRGTLSTGETMAVVSEVADALQVAHDAGIVHRDLKPGNILIAPDGRVMIVDFGIAHAAGGEPLTQTGALVGTADYLSPEQASGRPATHASDLYSLGVVAFACLTGTPPFHRDSDIATALAHIQADLPELPEAVPDDAVALIGALLAKAPGERPPSATAVARQAATLASSVPTTRGRTPDSRTAGGGPATLVGGVTAVTPDAGEARPRRPRGRTALLGSAAIVLIAAALGWVLMGGTDTVVVPDVKGTSQEVASSRLESAGLTIKVHKVNVAGAKAGEVVRQSPAAGTEVDQDSTVTLSVATGRIRIPVDQLVGSTYLEAVARLDDLGLKATATYATSAQAAGTVIAVEPTSTAKIGSTVTLTVASGVVEPDPPDKKSDSKKPKGSGDGDKKSPKPTRTTPTPSPVTTTPTSPGPSTDP